MKMTFLFIYSKWAAYTPPTQAISSDTQKRQYQQKV